MVITRAVEQDVTPSTAAQCACAMETVSGNDSRIMTVPDVYALQHFYLKLWLGWNWQVQESGE